jgi:hypothetical protein
MRAWLANALEGRRLGAWLVVVAAIECVRALFVGLVGDDRWHRAFLTHDATWVPASPGRLWLFTFATGDAAENRRFIEDGFAPWWTTPTLRISFFRPVASLTHALDYALWPSSPLLMHVHSLVWYAALVLVATALLRRLAPSSSPRWVFGLAALVYAIDHTHGLPVAWIANRNALVAATFALGALLAHDAAARGARPCRACTALSALLLALALGGGESAVAILPFLAAHAWLLDRRATKERALSLAPHTVIVALWIIVYRAGCFGVTGSGVYYDPLRETFSFARAAAVNLPLLLSAELGAPAPDLYTFVPFAAKVGFVVVALLVLAWSSAAIARLVRSDDDGERRTARFFLVSSALAVLPACATFPSARLLLIPGFGLVGLVAMVAGGVLRGASWVPAGGGARALVRSFAAWSCGAHVLLSPLAMQVAIEQMPLFDRVIVRLASGVPTDGSAKDKRLVLVNAPDTAFAYYSVVTELEAGKPAPRRMLLVAGGARDVRVVRTGERTFSVHVDQGFYRAGTELLYRGQHDPMPVGTRLSLSDATIEVTHATNDGVPDEATFTFLRPLDEGYVFRAWDGRSLVPFAIPNVGSAVSFAGRMPDLE